MKYLIYLSFCFFVFAGCSKKDPLDLMPTSAIIEGYDSEMISTFSDKTIEVKVKHTLLDTSYSNNLAAFDIHAIIKDDDSLTFNWFFDNRSVINPAYRKAWKSEQWVKGSSISIDVSKLSGTIPVTVDIKFNKDGTVKKRTAKAILKQSFEKYDLFDYNFGMSRAEILKILRDSKGLSSMDVLEVSPKAITAMIKGFGTWDYGMHFGFIDNKLTSISEFGHRTGSVDEPSPYEFNNLLKRFNSPQTFKEVYNPVTKKNESTPSIPYSWGYNGIKFTVDYRDFEVQLNKTMKFRAITYEKLL